MINESICAEFFETFPSVIKYREAKAAIKREIKKQEEKLEKMNTEPWDEIKGETTMFFLWKYKELLEEEKI